MLYHADALLQSLGRLTRVSSRLVERCQSSVGKTSQKGVISVVLEHRDRLASASSPLQHASKDVPGRLSVWPGGGRLDDQRAKQRLGSLPTPGAVLFDRR